jgi:phosphopantothenoylcysteine decarboxylase/phosphopantothenate--cysteine ligase
MFEYIQDSIRIAKKGKLSKASLSQNEQIHLIQKQPYLFMAAAISDYIPEYKQEGKLKKEMLGESWALNLKKNRDILSSLNKEGIITVGFKAEMDKEKALQNAQNMLKQKNLNAVCLNILEDSSSFGTTSNAIEFITQDGIISLPQEEKLELSFKILESAKKL